jgi:hypothetical protein
MGTLEGFPNLPALWLRRAKPASAYATNFPAPPRPRPAILVSMSSSGTPALGPFRGLAPYDESSAALFYGRTEETAALYQLVTRTGTRVLALCGEAGVGKTSLVRAGFFPLLAKHDVTTVCLGTYVSA